MPKTLLSLEITLFTHTDNFPYSYVSVTEIDPTALKLKPKSGTIFVNWPEPYLFNHTLPEAKPNTTLLTIGSSNPSTRYRYKLQVKVDFPAEIIDGKLIYTDTAELLKFTNQFKDMLNRLKTEEFDACCSATYLEYAEDKITFRLHGRGNSYLRPHTYVENAFCDCIDFLNKFVPNAKMDVKILPQDWPRRSLGTPYAYQEKPISNLDYFRDYCGSLNFMFANKSAVRPKEAESLPADVLLKRVKAILNGPIPVF